MIKKTTITVGNKELDIVNNDQHPQYNISVDSYNEKDYDPKSYGTEEKIPNWIIKQLK